MNLLQNQQKFKDVYGYLVLNFRATEDRENQTYMVNIAKFLNKLTETGKKSINLEEVKQIGKLVPQKKLRKNYLYDIKGVFT